MRVGLTSVVVFGLSVLCMAQEHAFEFKIPEGWVDLSPGAKEPHVDGVPEDLVRLGKSGKYDVYAVDLNGPEGGYIARMRASVKEGNVSVDDRRLDEFGSSLLDGMSKAGPAELLEKEIVTLGEAEAFRYVLSIDHPEAPLVTTMMYVIPGRGERFAILSYGAASQDFDTYRGVFEASAVATAGGASQLRREIEREARRTATATYWVLVSGAIGAFLYWTIKRTVQRKEVRRGRRSLR